MGTLTSVNSSSFAIDKETRSGRFDVRVDPKIIELPNNRVDLVFEITEGGKTVWVSGQTGLVDKDVAEAQLRDLLARRWFW